MNDGLESNNYAGRYNCYNAFRANSYREVFENRFLSLRVDLISSHVIGDVNTKCASRVSRVVLRMYSTRATFSPFSGDFARVTRIHYYISYY